MTTIRRLAISIAAVALILVFWVTPALGSVHTWIGPTNGLWSNAANWSGGVPTSGEPGGTIVQFGSGTTSTMDIAGLVVDEIRFTSSNNTVNGSTTLTVNGAALVQNVVSEGEDNTLSASLPLTLTGASLEAASSKGMLTIAGSVGGTVGMVFAGTGGEFDLTGQNTFSGSTTIEAGKLHIATPIGYVIVGSSLNIGDGLGTGAELVLDQSSDISPETPVVVASDGVMNFKGHADTAKSLTVNGGSVLGATLTMSGALTMHEGTVSIAAILVAGSLDMTGGTISGPGTLDLGGDIEATSTASEPAAVSAGVLLAASPTVTVSSGTPPELRLTGPISELGGSRGITKAGSGTLLTSATNTYTGTTTISAGALVADGSQAGPFAVGPNGTLEGSGSVGATTVEGVLAPTAPGLRSGSLSFGPTGRLDATITSTAAGTIPATIVTGTVTIDPAAVLDLVFSPGIALPHGSSMVLIENDGTDSIEGHFSGVPSGTILSTSEGVPLLVSYTGDGNDMTLTASNVPPQVGSIAATPSPVQAGQPVALSGAATSTNRASAFGATFGLTVAHTCLRPGASFAATLAVKRVKGKPSGRTLVKVTKVVFTVGGKSPKTARRSPFHVQLTVPSLASGATVEVSAVAHLVLRNGKHQIKSVAASVKVC